MSNKCGTVVVVVVPNTANRVKMSVWTRVAFERAETNWNSRHAPFFYPSAHHICLFGCAVLRCTALCVSPPLCEASIVGKERENCHRPPKKDLGNERERWRRRHSPTCSSNARSKADGQITLPFLSSISAGNGGSRKSRKKRNGNSNDSDKTTAMSLSRASPWELAQ